MQPAPRGLSLRASLTGWFRSLSILAVPALVLINPVRGDVPDPYPMRAPIEQYLMPKDTEIALARTAAPESVSHNASVMVLGPDGYATAVSGTNGFVCLVERAWSSPSNDPEFWNPKSRSPLCFNAPGARYCVPLLALRTQLALAGKSKAEIVAGMAAARAAGKFPVLESGAMCFMMAKGGHLSDSNGHWHPHLMFYGPVDTAAAWGANLPGSPVFGVTDDLDRVTIFLIPVRKWSDGSSDMPMAGMSH